MSKRLQGVVVGVVIGVLLAGGLAYAVTVVPTSSADQYYACVSPTGTVEYRTIRLNKKPSVTACDDPADSIRSWGAQAPLASTSLYNGVTFGFSAAGCSTGLVSGRIKRLWGTPLYWKSSGCDTVRVTKTNLYPANPANPYLATIATVFSIPGLPSTQFVQPQGWDLVSAQHWTTSSMVGRAVLTCSAETPNPLAVFVSCSVQAADSTSAAAIADVTSAAGAASTLPIEIRKVS